MNFLILIALCLGGFTTLSADVKTALLIITTDDKPAFLELQKIWSAYMNSDPAHFEVFFLRADPDINTIAEISENKLTVKTKDSYKPGITNKTIMGLEALEPRLDEFDYVIRTNLSSFYAFDNLLKYLNQLPREKCYCGVALQYYSVPFVSGASIILSCDMARLMIKDHKKLESYKKHLPDDVWIGLFFQQHNIPMIPAQRWDYQTHAEWLEHNHRLEDYAYHFRAKNSYNFRTAEESYQDELLTLKALLTKYYPNHMY